ncbi:Ribonuclease H [Zancudomyces culisetae]|uniref:ribonuclease H n=1 Tax=Zancudomyces culisetae TaxID=1213189 RepID=A0A1R1PLP8_ZANCU|nr:Ribonuclease H [Zancudomyces culisetae]|eukprot:OMH81867.1 Ribonuclease H [Zancudomyces culisetae]
MEQAQRFMQYLPVEEKKKKTNPPPILITKPSVLTTQPQQSNSTPTTNSGNQPDERGFGKKRKSNRAPLIESSKRFSSGESSDLRIKKEESDVRDHYYQNPRNDFGRKRYYDYSDRDSTSANTNRDDSRRVRDDRRSRHRDRSPEPYRRDSRNSDSYARKSQVPSVFDDIVLKPEKNSEEFVSSTTLSQSTAINATIPSSTILQPGRKTNATDKGGTKGGTNKIFSVYTDGACSGNGKGGSQAGLGVFFGDGDPRNLSERLQGPQTNNRAELMKHVLGHSAIHGNEMADRLAVNGSKLPEATA